MLFRLTSHQVSLLVAGMLVYAICASNSNPLLCHEADMEHMLQAYSRKFGINTQPLAMNTGQHHYHFQDLVSQVS